MGNNPVPGVTSRLGLKLHTRAENETLYPVTESACSSAGIPTDEQFSLIGLKQSLGPYYLNYLRGSV